MFFRRLSFFVGRRAGDILSYFDINPANICVFTRQNFRQFAPLHIFSLKNAKKHEKDADAKCGVRTRFTLFEKKLSKHFYKKAKAISFHIGLILPAFITGRCIDLG